MIWLAGLVLILVFVGSLLAMSEAAISRMNRVRAMVLVDDGRRNAAVLEKIETDPANYLNSVYFAVLVVQNASAVLVALLAERLFGDAAIVVASVVFTLIYFVAVEAMSKTFAILHNDRVALFLAPLVFFLSRLFRWPTRGLIGISNVLLPGRGIKSGPFVSEEDILSMAEVGHEEGAIDEEEKDLIHSIFEFGDTVVREVMVPRPDMIVVEAHRPVRKAMDLAIRHGYSRIPVYDKDPDEVVGIVYAKDLFKALRRNGDSDRQVEQLMRKPLFVPETKPVPELLREMQDSRIHMSIVVDEYGDVAGLVTLEDIIEEIVGEIIDEYDVDDPALTPIGDDSWRVKAKMAITELNELLDTELPEDEEWSTVGGLMSGVLGRLPTEGDKVNYHGLELKAEKVTGRRLSTVFVHRTAGATDE